MSRDRVNVRVPAGTWVRTTEPLLWLTGAGHEVRNNARYAFDCRRRPDRPHYVLQLTLAGVGFYENARRGRSLIRPGMAFFDHIPGAFRYGYPPDAHEPYDLLYVGFGGATAARWCRRIIRSFGNVLDFGQPDVNPIAPLMRALAHPVAGASADQYTVSAQLYQLLMIVTSTLSRSRVETAPRIRRAVEILSRRAHDPSLSVHHLAGEVGCSREYLARQFRAATGVSPSDYLTQQRLRLAARRMRSGDEKLETIARACGFAGANYLCRVFRQRVGVTPAQFRRHPWMAGP